ncbi:hypothetical protein ACFQL1_08550 [Halomicroarcula sp. GCM10025709]|uniref:DUF7289 family protein n=1 Tax=Haloarcula TaxID=2237 RepID=UPI0024C2326C|nr:hypothetical protein [Halomicroarcula sp. YJ-61-S]
MADRGQSEAVGFATVFGIVLLTLTVVAAGGVAGLEDVRSHQQLSNTQRSFAVLADNADAVAAGAPSRATQMRLGGGTLAIGDTVEIAVSGTAVGNASRSFSHTETYEPLVYSLGDSQVGYSSGALVRAERDGAVLFREPAFVLTNETVLLPLLSTTHTDRTAVGGSSTLVRTVRTDRELVRANRSTYDVTVSVTSPRAAAWEDWLADRTATTCSRTGSTVTCTLRTQRLFVSVDHVAVSFG